MTTVSVIIPTYERADVLPRAVESVLAQTFEDFELLVVDDGSTDGTVEYLESVEDDRLRTLVHETNRGCNAARNTGIEAAEGEYVAFLDSDDEWQPAMLERELQRMAERSEAVAVYCEDERIVGGSSGPFVSTVATLLEHADPERPKEGGAELAGEILADWLHTGAGSTLLAETEVVREIGGFDEDFSYFRDPEFLVRLVQAGELAYVDEPLVTRYVTGAPDAERIEQSAEQLLEKHADLVADLEAEGYEVHGAHALLLAKAFLAEGKFRRGVAYLGEAAIRGRQVPGVCWSAGAGLRRRTDRSVVPLVGVLALVLLVASLWLLVSSRSSA